ncbi:hypothetical protein PsYK624_118810 [Phanerochaete sordida]|uniref:F-box domain-containing protein n=1 Tax=Phanerochaete sordida TaxID=48140 RepID=A0A9P3LHU3_9APHY|nr:hypothetical protein PsYK624_118810 [Phanerochaete sordida]
MDALWKNPRDGMCLVKLLKDTTFAGDNIDGDRVMMMALPPPSASDWVRFTNYARRVQTLDVISYTETMDTPLQWWSVLDHLPITQVFPRLRSVRWKWASEYRCSQGALLLKAPLRRLAVNDLDLRGVEQLIELLPGCSATLERLQIGTRFRGEDDHLVAASLWRALAMLHQLAHLDVSLYVPQAFCRLASLSHLTSLCLLIDSADTEDAKASFPALKSLELSVKTDTDAVAKLLQRMVLPVLEHLSITDYFLRRLVMPMHRANAAHVRLTLQEVAKVTSLRSFAFKCHRSISMAPTEALDAQALSSLHALRGLETLDVAALAVSMGAADVEPMARAWPRMQNLQLYERHAIFGTHPPCVLEVVDILPFARLCPHLRELGLLVHIGPPGPAAPPDDDSELPVHAALKTLRAAVSLPPFTPALRVLARTFPAAEVKGYGHDPDRDEAVNEAKKALVHELYGTQFEDTDGLGALTF